MNTKDDALKLALEALEWINRVNAMDFEYQRKARESLNAIYEALAEQPAQQQEPVAITNAMAFAFHRAINDGDLPASDLEQIKHGLSAAFANTSPQSAQQQEPVACRDEMCACRGGPCASCPDGEHEKELADVRDSRDFYKRRTDELQKAQSQMRDPERTMVCDILANGRLLVPAGGRYSTSPPASKPWVGLTDEEIEKGRDETFSINNPYCPCDSKTMRKAVRWAEAKLREKNA